MKRGATACLGLLLAATGRCQTPVDALVRAVGRAESGPGSLAELLSASEAKGSYIRLGNSDELLVDQRLNGRTENLATGLRDGVSGRLSLGGAALTFAYAQDAWNARFLHGTDSYALRGAASEGHAALTRTWGRTSLALALGDDRENDHGTSDLLDQAFELLAPPVRASRRYVQETLGAGAAYAFDARWSVAAQAARLDGDDAATVSDAAGAHASDLPVGGSGFSAGLALRWRPAARRSFRLYGGLESTSGTGDIVTADFGPAGRGRADLHASTIGLEFRLPQGRRDAWSFFAEHREFDWTVFGEAPQANLLGIFLSDSARLIFSGEAAQRANVAGVRWTRDFGPERSLELGYSIAFMPTKLSGTVDVNYVLVGVTFPASLNYPNLQVHTLSARYRFPLGRLFGDVAVDQLIPLGLSTSGQGGSGSGGASGRGTTLGGTTLSLGFGFRF